MGFIGLPSEQGRNRLPTPRESYDLLNYDLLNYDLL